MTINHIKLLILRAVGDKQSAGERAESHQQGAAAHRKIVGVLALNLKSKK